MSNGIKQSAGTNTRNFKGVKAVLSEIENILESFSEREPADLPPNVFAKLEKIEVELKQIEKRFNRKETAKSNLNEKFEKIASAQINMYRDTVFRTLSEVCNNILNNSREIERLNSVIARLPSLNRGEIEMSRMLYNIEIDKGKFSISRREREVLIQLLGGKTNREISTELGISEKTVKNHLWKVYKKLGVENRTQLFHRLITT